MEVEEEKAMMVIRSGHKPKKFKPLILVVSLTKHPL